jgi:hypothetical protein
MFAHGFSSSGSATQHVRHENVGDREVVRRDELTTREPAIELLQAHVRPIAQRLAWIAPLAASQVDKP